MPRSSGSYTPPSSSWYPATNGASATPTDWNALLADISAALTQSLSQDGQTNPTANLPMAGFKFTGAGNASGSGQFVVWGQNATLGNLTTVTQAGSDNSTLAATTAWVTAKGYATTASPALVTPTVTTTPAQFDNSLLIASTAFVQRALGNHAGYVSYSASGTIATGDVGKFIIVPNGSPSITLALPAGLQGGSRVVVYNNTASNTVTLSTGGSITSGIYSGTTIPIAAGQVFDLVADGSNNWAVEQGDPKNQRAFAGTTSNNGSFTHPSGLIVKFGTTAHGGGAGRVTQATTFTTAFPNAVVSIQLTDTIDTNVCAVTLPSITGFTASIVDREFASNATAGTTNWVAIGY